MLSNDFIQNLREKNAGGWNLLQNILVIAREYQNPCNKFSCEIKEDTNDIYQEVFWTWDVDSRGMIS